MSSLQEAIKEAYATSPSNIVQIESIELNHPSLAGSVYLVKAQQDLILGLEDGYNEQTPGPSVLFTACSFGIKRPAVNADGLQELQLTIDNVDRRISDFVKQTTNFTTEVKCIYRLHLSTDLTSPQLVPPLELTLSDIEIGDIQVSARASVSDLVNKTFPSENYTRRRFPGLGS